MTYTLAQCLSKVPDPRRAQGKRTTKSQMFILIILSNLCGHFGGRAISRFIEIQESSFNSVLCLKHKVPSHVTITDFINRVDQKSMIKAFNNWTIGFVPLQKEDFISGDGKVLGSTVVAPCSKNQDFQAIVSLFCQESGLVYALDEYKNKNKESEINVLRFLVDKLEGMGLTIFLDALHCQKKL